MSLHARIDINLPKDKAIRRAGAMAELLYIRGILLSKEILSDGEIDRSQLSLCAIGIPGSAEKHARSLVDAGLWEATAHGWRIPSHKWAKWQITAFEVEEKRAKTSERVRKFRDEKAKRNAAVTALQNAGNAECNAGCNTTPEPEPEPEPFNPPYPLLKKGEPLESKPKTKRQEREEAKRIQRDGSDFAKPIKKYPCGQCGEKYSTPDLMRLNSAGEISFKDEDPRVNCPECRIEIPAARQDWEATP